MLFRQVLLSTLQMLRHLTWLLFGVYAFGVQRDLSAGMKVAQSAVQECAVAAVALFALVFGYTLARAAHAFLLYVPLPKPVPPLPVVVRR